MSAENKMFEMWRETITRRYGDAFDQNFVQQAHENLVSAYRKFIASGCADPHFINEICTSDLHKSAQRLGEVLLYERLSHLGLSPTSKAKGPDFQVEINGRTVWLELITPSAGDDSRIGELIDAQDPLHPCPEQASELKRRSLLRVSNAVSAKIAKYEQYLEDKVVSAEAPLVIVVNDALLCPDSFYFGVSFNAGNGIGGVSLAEHAVNSVGPSMWVKRQNSGQYVLEHTFRETVKNRPEPKKDGSPRQPVPVSLFGNPTEPDAQAAAKRASIISAVLQVTLREDYGVFMLLRDKAETDERLCEALLSKGILVKNQNSKNPLDAETSSLLTTVVVAPALTTREVWDLENRRLKQLFGDAYQEKPFPDLRCRSNSE